MTRVKRAGASASSRYMACRGAVGVGIRATLFQQSPATRNVTLAYVSRAAPVIVGPCVVRTAAGAEITNETLSRSAD